MDSYLRRTRQYILATCMVHSFQIPIQNCFTMSLVLLQLWTLPFSIDWLAKTVVFSPSYLTVLGFFFKMLLVATFIHSHFMLFLQITLKGFLSSARRRKKLPGPKRRWGAGETWLMEGKEVAFAFPSLVDLLSMQERGGCISVWATKANSIFRIQICGLFSYPITKCWPKRINISDLSSLVSLPLCMPFFDG